MRIKLSHKKIRLFCIKFKGSLKIENVIINFFKEINILHNQIYFFFINLMTEVFLFFLNKRGRKVRRINKSKVKIFIISKKVWAFFLDVNITKLIMNDWSFFFLKFINCIVCKGFTKAILTCNVYKIH